MKPFYFIHKLLLLSILLFLVVPVIATNYYVNASSTSSIANGSLANPWKTIEQVNNTSYILLPGDSVFFKRGELYTGRLYLDASGTSIKPIVYTSYGVGAMPEFTSTTTFSAILIDNQRFIELNGLKIIDKTMDPNDHSITATLPYGIIINNSPYITVQNCDISLVGIGIEIKDGSDFNQILNNYIHNLRIVKNTIGGNEDDFGANGLVVGSFHNLIQRNFFEYCWAYSYDFGRDGGAIEFYNTNMNENQILYNTAKECIGFLEVGSEFDAYAIDNVIAYNKIINCGPIGVFHNTVASHQVKVYNTQYFNNVIINNNKNFVYSDKLFWVSDNTVLDVINFKNNIVWLTTGFSFANANMNPDVLVHKNNIYHITSGGDLGVQLDSTEIRNGYQDLFMDTTALDPINWDLRPTPNSEAINFGVNLGFLKDFAGTLLDAHPDAGLYEYLPPVPPIPTFVAVADANAIKCNGGTTIVTVAAFGGTPPYFGIGNFTEQAGTHTYYVTDSKGLRDTASITLAQPLPLQLDVSAGLILQTGAYTTITASAQGGTIPYVYNIDNALYQLSNFFYKVYPGNYIIGLKDANGCIQTKSISVAVTGVSNYVDKQLKISVFPNPSSNYFTVGSLKLRGSPVPIILKVYNSTGNLVYTIQGLTNVQYTFGSNFIKGTYTLIAIVGGTTQAFQLIKL
jgi:hypothetical protein